MLQVIIGAAIGLTVLLAIVFFLYWRYRQKATETKSATAMSELASAELGMRLPTAPAATLVDMETRVGTSSNPAGRTASRCWKMRS